MVEAHIGVAAVVDVTVDHDGGVVAPRAVQRACQPGLAAPVVRVFGEQCAPRLFGLLVVVLPQPGGGDASPQIPVAGLQLQRLLVRGQRAGRVADLGTGFALAAPQIGTAARVGGIGEGFDEQRQRARRIADP